jgi:hypothetical protein
VAEHVRLLAEMRRTLRSTAPRDVLAQSGKPFNGLQDQGLPVRGERPADRRRTLLGRLAEAGFTPFLSGISA